MSSFINAHQQLLNAEIFGIAFQIWLVFAMVILVAVAFFREWASPDVVALCAFGGTFVTGILGTDELLAVFSNRAPITIACMFVISAALERTGAIDIIGDLFMRYAGKTELRVMFSLMLVAAVLSAFVNNTPVVVVFLPIVNSLAKNLGLNASRLLIPLSFASILGGTCTLTGTSTNLIIDNLAQQVSASAADEHARVYAETHNLSFDEAYAASNAADLVQRPFGMFELSKIGIIYAIIGFVYLGTVGRKLLPKRNTLDSALDPPESRRFLTQFRVEKDSPLIGKTVLDSLLKEIPEADVLEVRRRGRILQTPLDELEIRQGDRLLLTIYGTSFEDLKETEGIRFPAQKNLNLRELETRELKLMEGIVGSSSEFRGKTLGEIKFRQRFGVHILAVHRKGHDLQRKKDLSKIRLTFGDTLLIEGPVDAINQLQKNGGLCQHHGAAPAHSAPQTSLASGGANQRIRLRRRDLSERDSGVRAARGPWDDREPMRAGGGRLPGGSVEHCVPHFWHARLGQSDGGLWRSGVVSRRYSYNLWELGGSRYHSLCGLFSEFDLNGADQQQRRGRVANPRDHLDGDFNGSRRAPFDCGDDVRV